MKVGFVMIRLVLQVLCVLLSGWLLLSCAGNAPRETAESAAPAPQSASAPQHFFWKVSDSNSSVWLLGSIHFADSSFYPLDSVIETAFVNAEELAVEIDVTDDSVNTEIASESMQHGMMPAGKRLQDLLPTEMWNSVDSICNAWGIPSITLQVMRPWLAAMTLSAFAIQRAGIDPTLGVDAVLLDRAAHDGKAIVGLETASEQIGALADTTESDSAGIFYLKSTLREVSELDSMVARIVRAWKTGDDALLRETMADEKDYAEGTAEKELSDKLDEKVYKSRNVKMAERIAEFLSEDRNVFVVVGAAHLVLDEDNVVDLLRRRGLTVQRF
ncbi:MAG: TraB/GumN family protein [Fibrobacter sp.]|nr:TraB/GumN family protein [Fibrobacter sp.]